MDKVRLEEAAWDIATTLGIDEGRLLPLLRSAFARLQRMEQLAREENDDVPAPFRPIPGVHP